MRLPAGRADLVPPERDRINSGGNGGGAAVET